MAHDFGSRPAGGIAQERQIRAQRERQSSARQGQSNPEKYGFDEAGLALFFWVVKVIIIKASCAIGKKLMGEEPS